MSNIAIILAAGSSNRFTTKIPKQYEKINDKAIISYSIEKFLDEDDIDDIVLAINPKHKKFYSDIVKKYDLQHVIIGGKKRQESVFNALLYLEKISPKNVVIHDSARPFLNNRVIQESLSLLNKHDAAIPVIPIEDTIKKVNKNQTLITLNRDDLYRIQTPQSFSYKTLYSCHKNVSHNNFTDDSGILENFGLKVVTFKGSQLNFKITTNDDLNRARKLYNNSNDVKENMQQINYRVGIGYDVHRFEESLDPTNIILGGIKIDFNKKIIAHSDGDVLMHALVDALLGSIAVGDIGEYFPPSNPKYKNADSKLFLEKAMELLQERQAEIVNIDANIICEKPKISPHKQKIRENLATILKLDINQVSIKATTTEKLGFTGREEGIAAQVIANVKI